MMVPSARRVKKPNGRMVWRGGLMSSPRSRIVIDCGHYHNTKDGALCCASAMLRCDPGSLMAEEIAKASQ